MMDWWLAFGFVAIGFGVIVWALRAARWLRAPGQRPARPSPPAPQAAPPPPAPTGPRIPLETQIEELAAAGLRLNPGIGIDDLLGSFPRDEFEGTPYELLLIMFGFQVEKDGNWLPVSSLAVDIDMECIQDEASYVHLLQQLASVTGRSDLFQDLSSAVDFRSQRATLTYQVGARSRTLHPAVQNDWADPAVLSQVLHDIVAAIDDGRSYWGVENGQSSTWFFIDAETAARANALSNGLLIGE
jgi:hypothetical protein